MKNEKKYNVYIVSNTGIAVALIGENMTPKNAEQRVMTGLMRIDRANYFVTDVEVGSEIDLKHKKEVIE